MSRVRQQALQRRQGGATIHRRHHPRPKFKPGVCGLGSNGSNGSKCRGIIFPANGQLVRRNKIDQKVRCLRLRIDMEQGNVLAGLKVAALPKIYGFLALENEMAGAVKDVIWMRSRLMVTVESHAMRIYRNENVTKGLSEQPVFALRLGNELEEKAEKWRSPNQHVRICTGLQHIVVVVQKTVKFIVNEVGEHSATADVFQKYAALTEPAVGICLNQIVCLS